MIFIYGKDTYRSKAKLKELITQYQDDLELIKISGDKTTLDGLKNKLNAVSIFSLKRLIVIENMSANKEQKEITAWLNKYTVSPEDVLIFHEGKVDKKTSIYKYLKKSAENFEFEELKPYELKTWIEKYITAKDGQIDRVALEELLMNNKNDLWFLASELDKLLAYNKKITLESVQQLTSANFDDNIFNLADAVGKGDKTTALELINRQLEIGTAPIYLLSMIVRQFRILIQIKEVAGNSGYVNNAVVAKELGLHPFVVQKSIAQAQNYELNKLQGIYQKLLDLDMQLKSSKISSEALFTKLVICN